MTGVSLTGLLDGDDPLRIDGVEHELLVAKVEQALFGSPSSTLRLHRYTVLEKVGRGGGGVVYRGYDPDLQRPVAIKVLAGDPAGLQGLLREAQALARLKHPNVVEVYDVFREADDGRVVVIMEWVEGGDVRAWLERERPGVDAVLALYRHAGRGLAEAHRAGLVHRDVKPANLLVSDDGHVRVADFGLARAAGTAQDAAPGTLHGEARSGLVGTPAYMAPEQWRREPVTARSDQYAFCASVVEGLLGDPNPEDLDRRLRRRGVPSRTRRALTRGLDPDPRRRFEDMDGLLAELAPRRRRWLPAIATVATLGVLAGFLAPESAAPAGACAADAGQLRGAWDERQDAVRRSLARPDLAAPVDRTMTRWVARWESAYAQTCAAELEPSIFDARRRCLQSQRWHAEALVDLLASADPAEAVRAVTAVAALPSPRSCEADAEAGLAGWTPEDPRAQASADEIRRRLAAATATMATGRYGDAAEVCEKILADLDALHFEPLELLARLTLGRMRVLDGRPTEGGALLRQAYFAAVEGGHDREAAEAATGLTFVVGYQLADPIGGKAWARHADAALTRLGLEGEPRAELLNHRGAIAGLTGDLEASRRFHEEALAIREPFADERPTALAHTLNNLGNAWLRIGDNERAGEYHARALALRREAYGAAHPIVAVSLNNLGSVIMLTDGPSAARETFEESLATWEAALGPDHPDLLQPLHNLTIVAMQEKRYDDAEAWLSRARRLADQRLPPDHPGHAMVRGNQAELWLETSQAERALPELSALLVAERQRYGSTHASVGDAVRVLGRALRQLGRHREAVEHFVEAREIYRRTLSPTHDSVHRAMFLEGLSRLELGQPRRALALLEPLTTVELGDEERGELHAALARARGARR